MQQITLTEYTESYAVSVEDGLPETDMPIWFKTKKGKKHEGFFYTKANIWEDHFEANNFKDFDVSEILSWHPVTVDM